MKGQECERCHKFYEMLGQEMKEEVCQGCSRHRDNNKLMNTPPTFYNLDFDSPMKKTD